MAEVTITRRQALAGAAVLGGVFWGGWRILPGLFQEKLALAPLKTPAGFRQLAGGALSLNRGFLSGLDRSGTAQFEETVNAVRQDICRALFPERAPVKDIVPIAFFTDYNCPYCQVLTRKLAALEARPESGIRVFWHELPILGETSVLAAKGALAARRQGAYRAFHQRLMRSRFVATDSYLNALADRLGIDGEKLIRDMKAPEVEQEIRENRALAKIFGIAGTPALVVGRTLVMGEIDDSTLDRLIRLEQREGPLKVCQSN